MVVGPGAAEPPTFRTASRRAELLPARRAEGPAIASSRSGSRDGLALSVSTSFDGFWSPAVETLAVVVTELPTLESGSTWSVSCGAVPPGATGPASSQANVWPVITQLQPVPLPSVGVMPAGTVAETRTGPVVGAVPALLTMAE